MTENNDRPVENGGAAQPQPGHNPMDEWQEVLEDIPEWIREPLVRYGKQVLAGMVMVALTAVIVSGYSQYRKSLENKAAAALGAAMVTQEAMIRINRLQKVIKEHSGTDAADQAVLLLAAAQRENGDMQAAASSFQKAADIFGADTPAGQSAIMGSGYAAETMGNNEKAVSYYDRAISTEIGFEKIALSDKARALASLGKTSEAISCYDRLTDMNPGEQDLDFIRYQVMKLSSK